MPRSIPPRCRRQPVKIDPAKADPAKAGAPDEHCRGPGDVYIAFKRAGNSWVERAIALLSGDGPYCHAEIYFPAISCRHPGGAHATCPHSACAGYRSSRGPGENAPGTSPAADVSFACHAGKGAHFYAPAYGDNWDLVKVPWDRALAMASCLSVEGDHYDYIGVVNFVLRDWLGVQFKRIKGWWFCSADCCLVGKVSGGRQDLRREVAISPNALAAKIEGSILFGVDRREWKKFKTNRRKP